jgi:trimethylamine monooxygenase
MYIGMQDQYYTFTMFDAQAWYARDVVLGRIAVPARAQMEADISAWRERQTTLDGPADEIDFQTAYVRDLLERVDYPAFDLDLVREHFYTWEHHKQESITGYRDRSFSSPCTGSAAPVHHTPWWDEPDDSLTAFLRPES